MPDPTATPTGEDNAPAAGDAPVVAKAPETPPDPTFTSEGLKVVTTIRDELNTSKADLKTAQDQLTLYQAQLGNQQPAAAPAVPPDPFDGMKDEDILTVADAKKLKVSQGVADPQVAGLQNTVAKLQVQVQDPDYETTIRTYLPAAMRLNPAIAQSIQMSPNQLLAALNFAKLTPEYLAAQNKGAAPAQDDVSAMLDRIIENAGKPGSPASAGGAGTVSGGDRFKDMKQDDFDAHLEKVLAGQQ